MRKSYLIPAGVRVYNRAISQEIYFLADGEARSAVLSLLRVTSAQALSSALRGGSGSRV